MESVVPDSDHYFTAQPASPADRSRHNVTLDGMTFSLETAAGIFSPHRIDLGTTVLLRTVPKPPAGNVLDLGCGWGPIALTAALRQPAAHVWAVDVNERAVDLTNRNAAAIRQSRQLAPITATTPDGVPTTVTFAAILSNPPIRVGKDALHALLARWLTRLETGGTAHLVVQRNLGADSLHRWLIDRLGWPVDRIASAKGFRVLAVRRPTTDEGQLASGEGWRAAEHDEPQRWPR